MYHKIHHHISQEPHHEYMYPHFSSNHPRHISSGIIKAETVRYSRLSKTKDDYNFVHKLFTLRLTTLDYTNELVTENYFSWLPYYSHKRRQLTNNTHLHNNKQFTTAANTTNTLELTKLYATSYTNTIT